MYRRIPRPCDDSGAVAASACSGGSQAGRGAGHHGVLQSHLPAVKAPAAAGLRRQRSTWRRGAGRPGPVTSTGCSTRCACRWRDGRGLPSGSSGSPSARCRWTGWRSAGTARNAANWRFCAFCHIEAAAPSRAAGP
jgi:hypothetical protein